MPDFINPMLATLVAEPFDNEDWVFEIKWDGYRALAFINRGKVKLLSRNKHVLNSQFVPIVHSLEKFTDQAVLDGELVVLDSKGKSDFQLMQNYQKTAKGDLVYYIFDILYKNGKDLRDLPLMERKAILKKTLEQYSLPLVRYSDHIAQWGVKMYHEAQKMHLEGIVGKKISSPYLSRRSREWVKIKTKMRQEVVIGGFTEPRGSRKRFGALLVGVYNKKSHLEYVGHVGGGFNRSTLEDVYAKLIRLKRKDSPFKSAPKGNEKATWVKPQLICEVAFAEWTQDGIMRQPIFHGLRSDKSPRAVVKEIADPSNGGSSLTNLDKIYWPQKKYTKGDLIHYYEHVAPFILPHLKNRPIMLHRYPQGIAGQDFYQKNFEVLPKWMKTCEIEHEKRVFHYLLIQDVKSLLYAVNLGSIDLHPFMARCQNLDHPDYCLIDLDPHEIPFSKVIEAALEIHHLLEEIGVKHYCKTSGKKGLHICIPLHGKYSFEQSRQFAEIISHYVYQKLPKSTSLLRKPERRAKRVYLDCLQNRFAQTAVAPYAVRPTPAATVSTPLEWNEIDKDLDPRDFTIKTVLPRLKKKGDLFQPVLGPGVNFKSALAKLSKLMRTGLSGH